jgi:hypothetical protein
VDRLSFGATVTNYIASSLGTMLAMGTFFFMAGWLTPASVLRKGAGRYVRHIGHKDDGSTDAFTVGHSHASARGEGPASARSSDLLLGSSLSGPRRGPCSLSDLPEKPLSAGGRRNAVTNVPMAAWRDRAGRPGGVCSATAT